MNRLARVPRITYTDLPAALKNALGGTESEAESALLRRCEQRGLPKPETQVRIIPGRRYRYDLAWNDWKTTVEVQGSVYKARGAKRCPVCREVPSGRHTRGTGYESDATKSALAQIQGWICIYVTSGMIESGEAVMLIMEALKSRGWRA